MAETRAKVLASKVLHRGPVFGVRRDRLIEPGGVEVTRDVVTHAGSVVVLPLLPYERVLLIRQYRHAVGRHLWELVAGRVEPGEGLLRAARRELLEETGYTARRWRKLLEIYPTPGFVSERMTLFLAEDLSAGDARPEADERIESRALSLRELDGMIHRGILRDAKSIAGILYYARFARRRP